MPKKQEQSFTAKATNDKKPDSPIIAVLRKLGILRFGSVGGVYTSYKNRPDELMFDNVYDKAKDLVNKEDVAKVKKVIAKSVKSGLVAKIFFGLALVLGILFVWALLKGFGIGFWFLVVLVIWALIIWKFWKNIAGNTLKLSTMIIYLIIAFIVSFIIFSVFGPSDAKMRSVENTGSSVLSKDCNEWVTYTGINSSHYTFKYPKCYTIDESDRSTWVNNDKLPKHDDHFLVSWFDGPQTISDYCSSSTTEGETPLYAKRTTLAGLSACERSLTKTNGRTPDIFTLVIWNVQQPNRDWTILYWARAKSDQDIFRKMAESLVIK